ncbi:MAG: hypothetical protein KJO69_10275 [Gammaproteobacteria bacterium]|nr:hypothetical protein [Gammaproteobacteria bacterium]NNJ72318.1 hypothetical protein [Enterobacterales bacterium]
MKRLGLPQFSAADWINRINDSAYTTASLDSYSEGELVLELEQRIAKLLNKPAALFFSKGMTAQFCMLKVAESRAQKQRFIMSPYSHLAVDEEQSYNHLLGMEAIYPTNEPRPYVAADLNDSITAAAMLVE